MAGLESEYADLIDPKGAFRGDTIMAYYFLAMKWDGKLIDGFQHREQSESLEWKPWRKGRRCPDRPFNTPDEVSMLRWHSE